MVCYNLFSDKPDKLPVISPAAEESPSASGVKGKI